MKPVVVILFKMLNKNNTDSVCFIQQAITAINQIMCHDVEDLSYITVFVVIASAWLYIARVDFAGQSSRPFTKVVDLNSDRLTPDRGFG